ncbi:hypothetical protein [Dyadobacter sp. NIV53]|uniref:hypothetical protein n=1 Tax=Dyadobacter sp. NIV53 TaxID=2861765 RepID=UPI001C86D1E8|nr:hypothetical protein [Dyadobacter sp. NIV53]
MLETFITYYFKKPIPCTAVFISLLPLILILVKKAYLDSAFKILLIYLTFKLIIDLLMIRSASIHQNNIIYFNLSIPIYYALLSSMFYEKLDNKIYKKGIAISTVALVVFTIWDIFHSNSRITDFHNHRAVLFSKTIEGVLIIILVLLYFYELIKSLKIPDLLVFPFFWICSGLLLYYSSFIFIAPLLHYTATWNSVIDLGITRVIPYIFEIICALLFSIGIYQFSAENYARQ